MKDLAFALIFLTALVGPGCGKPSLAGKYGLQQEGQGFGPGAEKTELTLREDKTFDITLGLKLAEGTWKVENDMLLLSNGGQMGTSYRIAGSNLIPVANGKEVSFWRFVRK